MPYADVCVRFGQAIGPFTNAQALEDFVLKHASKIKLGVKKSCLRVMFEPHLSGRTRKVWMNPIKDVVLVEPIVSRAQWPTQWPNNQGLGYIRPPQKLRCIGKMARKTNFFTITQMSACSCRSSYQRRSRYETAQPATAA